VLTSAFASVAGAPAPAPSAESGQPPGKLPVQREGTREVVCVTPLGDISITVRTYGCGVCGLEVEAQAAQIGCFEVCLTPPHGEKVWIDNRLLDEQKHLLAKGGTFGGACACRFTAVSCCVALVTCFCRSVHQRQAEGVWHACHGTALHGGLARVPKV
jgi:hypothetical protein